MTPVMFLSDGYIANGAEPWKFPKSDDLTPIEVKFKTKLDDGEQKLKPYLRDEKLVRPWAVPGTPGLEHRIGGLEKQDVTGNVSYDSDNHEHMVLTREAKVEKIADHIPLQKLDSGAQTGKVLVIGWGSTYGAIKSACNELQHEGHSISHAHLRYIRPFPRNLGEIIGSFDKVIVPEINNGQLVKILRDRFLVDAIPYNKIKGVPMTKSELVKEFRRHL
jgi:2-oxoglutarate ferredoxin oxidoreductase subunit alpha